MQWGLRHQAHVRGGDRRDWGHRHCRSRERRTRVRLVFRSYLFTCRRQRHEGVSDEVAIVRRIAASRGIRRNGDGGDIDWRHFVRLSVSGSAPRSARNRRIGIAVFKEAFIVRRRRRRNTRVGWRHVAYLSLAFAASATAAAAAAAWQPQHHTLEFAPCSREIENEILVCRMMTAADSTASVWPSSSFRATFCAPTCISLALIIVCVVARSTGQSRISSYSSKAFVSHWYSPFQRFPEDRQHKISTAEICSILDFHGTWQICRKGFGFNSK
jgi:hypothetical protein